MTNSKRLGVATYRRYVEIFMTLVLEVLGLWLVLPIQVLGWWLSSFWTEIDWQALIVALVVTYVAYAPMYILIRLVLNGGDPENFRPIHSNSAGLISRALSAGAGFGIASPNTLVGIAAGVAIGATVGVASYIDKRHAFRNWDNERSFREWNDNQEE